MKNKVVIYLFQNTMYFPGTSNISKVANTIRVFHSNTKLDIFVWDPRMCCGIKETLCQVEGWGRKQKSKISHWATCFNMCVSCPLMGASRYWRVLGKQTALWQRAVPKHPWKLQLHLPAWVCVQDWNGDVWR